MCVCVCVSGACGVRLVCPQPGSTVQFAIDTRATLLGQSEDVAVLVAYLKCAPLPVPCLSLAVAANLLMAGPVITAAVHMVVAACVAWRRSYEHMGRALITCVSGCKCADNQLDAHTNEENSQTALHRITATQHAECVMQARGACLCACCVPPLDVTNVAPAVGCGGQALVR